MRLDIFKALWGMTGPLDEQLARIKAAGYAGIEGLLPEAGREVAFRRAVSDAGLDYIALIQTSGPDHVESFRRHIERAALCEPRRVTSHSASDAMGHGQAVDYFGAALEIEPAAGAPVAHETHRSRLLGTPWGTAEILRELPDLRIVADFSHWVVVAERLLEDRADDMAIACRATGHIHARVGHPEGPQVNDPRAPENAAFVTAHETWWRSVLEYRLADGTAVMTATPEYGPAPYLPSLPFTGQPVTDLWTICLWGADRLRALAAELGVETTPAG